MKNTIKLIYFLSLLFSIAVLPSCDDDDDPDPITERTTLLSKTWNVSSVNLDGTDVTNPSYSSFALTFRADGSYTTADGDPAFTGSGFWSIPSATNLNQLRIGNTDVTATLNSTNDQLTLNFALSGNPINGRVAGLSGNYVFVLTSN